MDKYRHKILVLSDGSTFEPLSEHAEVRFLTDEQNDELCNGAEPQQLEGKQSVVSVTKLLDNYLGEVE